MRDEQRALEPASLAAGSDSSSMGMRHDRRARTWTPDRVRFQYPHQSHHRP